ncbi:DUF2848 domain-containing protein [Gluconacetobacter azotocaptans]|uniref:DUF2848 domain-containing protein n=1 Tax=Gluconacetobacter azotocaptans TaxID=142834 RepID=A0A7W4JSS6_9PROT|nr:DUF2848 domain-containing protein [Gluconacetobacter azotocaptans]MBB2190296.1 DUF2848 domain-containing protein [Gluconacetobacter azotocaptans]MBM9400670.1 DUF2848 domain-containing protein [Gluconacetobacter azotocaptans]GBQ27417.1 hypothetical protein AA13594_0589 [Gluconacetobacter azotocaptans DSM 13594]
MKTYSASLPAVQSVVIAGWAGRDRQDVDHHIQELAAIGVAPPSRTPLFYRVSADRLTQAEEIEVVGHDTSGEAEPVLVWSPDGLLVGVGSDHTDRTSEAYSVALSKQLCPKIVGTRFWRFDDVRTHWDALVIRAYSEIDGVRALYQEGALSALLRPEELVETCRARDNGRLQDGSVMFCGTVPTIAGIFRADAWTVELYDPRTDTTLRHRYTVRELPVIA